MLEYLRKLLNSESNGNQILGLTNCFFVDNLRDFAVIDRQLLFEIIDFKNQTIDFVDHRPAKYFFG